MTDRFSVTLFNSANEIVERGDFEDAEAARVYRENAEALAREIGGRVEVSGEGETSDA